MTNEQLWKLLGRIDEALTDGMEHMPSHSQREQQALAWGALEVVKDWVREQEATDE